MTKSLTSYDILNIPEGASQDEVHAAYRRLAKIWHPDRHPLHLRGRAHDNFKLLQSAYADLKTPVARANYNHKLATMKRAVMAQQNKVMNDNSKIQRFVNIIDNLFQNDRGKGI